MSNSHYKQTMQNVILVLHDDSDTTSWYKPCEILKPWEIIWLSEICVKKMWHVIFCPYNLNRKYWQGFIFEFRKIKIMPVVSKSREHR